MQPAQHRHLFTLKRHPESQHSDLLPGLDCKTRYWQLRGKCNLNPSCAVVHVDHVRRQNSVCMSNGEVLRLVEQTSLFPFGPALAPGNMFSDRY